MNKIKLVFLSLFVFLILCSFSFALTNVTESPDYNGTADSYNYWTGFTINVSTPRIITKIETESFVTADRCAILNLTSAGNYVNNLTVGSFIGHTCYLYFTIYPNSGSNRYGIGVYKEPFGSSYTYSNLFPNTPYNIYPVNKTFVTFMDGFYGHPATITPSGNRYLGHANITTSDVPNASSGESFNVTSSIIPPNYAYPNSTLQGYCNATSTLGSSFSYNWYLNGVLNESGSIGNNSQTCYQESTNISNQSGIDGNCGLNYNTYGIETNAGFEIIDGNWNSFFNNLGGAKYTKTTYNKPLFAESGIWIIKDNSGVFNLSIPFSCWNYNSVNLTVYIYNAYYESEWWCYNTSSSGIKLHNDGGFVYEDGMYWLFNFPPNFEVNVGNISNSSLSVGQNWTLECVANDGVTVVSSNSSIVHIINFSSGVSSRIFGNITGSFPFIPVQLEGFCNATSTVNLSYNYKWFVNNELNVSGSTEFIPPNVEVNIGNISNSSLIMGQTWTLECSANDGVSNTSAVNSSLFLHTDLIQINATFKDEETLETVDNVTLDVIGSNYLANFSTSTGSLNLFINVSGFYHLIANSLGYVSSSFYITSRSGFQNNFTMYLLKNSSDLKSYFIVYDKYSMSMLEGSYVYRSIKIGDNWSVAEIYKSDISGKTVFNYVQGKEYKFTVEKIGYVTQTFLMIPSFDYYYLPLVAESNVNAGELFGTTWSITPFEPVADQLNCFNFTINNEFCKLSYFYFNVSFTNYTGSTFFSENSSTNSCGGVLSACIPVYNPVSSDMVKFNYVIHATDSNSTIGTFFRYVSGALLCYSPLGLITNCFGAGTDWITGQPPSLQNTSVFKNNQNPYGLGVGELILISTIITLGVVAGAYMVGGTLGAIAMALLMFGYFTFAGWIPSYIFIAFAISGVALLIFMNRSGG